MTNEPDEMKNENIKERQETNSINKQIKVTATSGEKKVPYIVTLVGIILLVYGICSEDYVAGAIGLVIGIYPWWAMGKISAQFNAAEQEIQKVANEIDSCMKQRTIILENLAKLIEKSVDTNEKIPMDTTKYKNGNFTDKTRNEADRKLNDITRNINAILENNPELKRQKAIQDAIQQNAKLQRKIANAKTLYNEAVNTWNKEIFEFPLKKIVAAKEGRTTRIPFIANEEIKQKSKEVFF